MSNFVPVRGPEKGPARLTICFIPILLTLNYKVMKATKTTTTTASKASKASKAKKATTTSNAKKASKPAKMSPAEIATAAAAILKAHKTTSAIKATGASLLEKYGRANWASIWAQIKVLRAATIKADGAAVRADLLSYSAAIESEYNRAKKSRRWSAFLAALGGKYATGADFIAANYPDTINGQPAKRAYYIAPNGLTIAAVFEVAPRDGKRATADLVAALTAAERAAVKASNGGKLVAVRATNERTAGEIVAAFNVETDKESGKAGKGKPLAGEVVAKYRAAGLVGWSPLADFNKGR